MFYEIDVAEPQPVHLPALVLFHEPFHIVDVLAANRYPAEHYIIGVRVHFIKPFQRVPAREYRHDIVATLFHDQEVFPRGLGISENI
jgi:hypothetical protein